MFFKLGDNIHVIGAFEDLRVNHIRDDRLVFAGEILIQESNQIFLRGHDSRICLIIRSSHDTPCAKLREWYATPMQVSFARQSTAVLKLPAPSSLRLLLFPA